MKNFFTSIENINDKFIGSVHDANNNQLVFRTSGAHNTPAEAIQEVNSFLQQQNVVSADIVPPVPVAAPVSEPVIASAEPQQPRRCCGR
jgi:hypothetical protein